MLFKGSIVNEFGDVVGRYWYREGMNALTINWCGIRADGFTDEGLKSWADRLEYQLVEDK